MALAGGAAPPHHETPWRTTQSAAFPRTPGFIPLTARSVPGCVTPPRSMRCGTRALVRRSRPWWNGDAAGVRFTASDRAQSPCGVVASRHESAEWLENATLPVRRRALRARIPSAAAGTPLRPVQRRASPRRNATRASLIAFGRSCVQWPRPGNTSWCRPGIQRPRSAIASAIATFVIGSRSPARHGAGTWTLRPTNAASRSPLQSAFECAHGPPSRDSCVIRNTYRVSVGAGCW
jgi:hypothetical protein